MRSPKTFSALPVPLLVLLLALASTTSSAWAQEVDVHHVEPPPAPLEHAPVLIVDIHASAQVPVLREHICPREYRCVFGAGIGVGAQLERRESNGLGLFAAYSLWLMDGGSVFEVSALHAIRLGLRWVLEDWYQIHPFVEGSVGFLAFGDTATLASVGGSLTLGGGAELEVSETVAVATSVQGWMISVAPFTSEADGAQRASDFGVNFAVELLFGVSLTLDAVVEDL